ncbi:prostasin-like [Sitophilus oryzae]|uniref:Prostasin-like n=1 Tax=Sitophilus oryzae TaxID=7048 RepID=A0A6J2XV60_SITOR|nr:prostasin-like [Sitophilus oryzae]
MNLVYVVLNKCLYFLEIKVMFRTMYFIFFLTWYYLGTTLGQQLKSPCPDVFQYEQNPSEPDRWYATVTLKTDAELTGVWFRVLLNKQTLQLGNWLVSSPYILTLRLNARQICPVGGTTTPSPVVTGQLFTNKPEIPDSLSGVSGGTSSGISPTVIQKPSLPIGSGDDDFYQGDFSLILKPQGPSPDPLTAECGTVIKQPRPLITHGQETTEGEFPWHAAIYHSKGIDLTYICGASLISDYHLITVAHCVTKRKSQMALSPSNLVIYLGKYYLRVWSNPGIQYRKVESIIVHPKFNPMSFSNDIAVLKLSKRAEFTDYVRPICLWEGNNQLDRVVDHIGTVTGWGFDETGKVTEQLTKAHMPIVSQETCIYSFPEFYSRFTSSTTFCAGFKNGTSVCNGDSGGGLILPKPGSNTQNTVWQIRGLVSISVALQNRFRCDSSHYVVFTDVSKYLDFVQSSLKI